MAYIVADGPPDTDATHAWTPASGSSPPTLNNPLTFPATKPWAQVLSIPGWWDPPDMEDHRDGRTAGPYEIPYPPVILGKTLVYEGAIWADDEQTFRNFTRAIQRGFTTDRLNEGLMTVTPYASIGGPVWTFNARCLDFKPDKDFTWSRNRPTGRFRRGFMLTLRMSNPRFYTGGVGSE